MASQHHFTDRIRAQLNDSNARNLELQALLAQRDDTLAACEARLQSTLSAASMTGDPHAPLQHEVRLAKEAAVSAETRLAQAFAIFNQEQSEWKKSVEKLQREVSERDAVLSDANYCLAAEAKDSATIGNLQEQLADSRAELKRTKQYAAGLQKQFEAEKRVNTSRSQFPATATGKNRTDGDSDDEEIVDVATRIKLERVAGARRQNPTAPMESQTTHGRSSCSDLHKSDATNIPYRPIFNKVVKPSQVRTPTRRRTTRTKQSKRKRSSLEEEDGDYDDLDIDMDDSGGLSAPKRAKAITREMEIEHVKNTCDFKAILKYDQDGNNLYLDSKKDLSDVCPHLWERIQSQHEAWERACGEEWRYDLERKYTASALSKHGAKPPCVSTKLLRINNGKATWREGCEGKYACLGCVREQWPCFTWDGDGLYLLPLHEKDKTFPEEAGFEIRTWLDIE